MQDIGVGLTADDFIFSYLSWEEYLEKIYSIFSEEWENIW